MNITDFILKYPNSQITVTRDGDVIIIKAEVAKEQIHRLGVMLPVFTQKQAICPTIQFELDRTLKKLDNSIYQYIRENRGSIS